MHVCKHTRMQWFYTMHDALWSVFFTQVTQAEKYQENTFLQKPFFSLAEPSIKNRVVSFSVSFALWDQSSRATPSPVIDSLCPAQKPEGCIQVETNLLQGPGMAPTPREGVRLWCYPWRHRRKEQRAALKQWWGQWGWTGTFHLLLLTSPCALCPQAQGQNRDTHRAGSENMCWVSSVHCVESLWWLHACPLSKL